MVIEEAHLLIAEKLERVAEGKTDRLMIFLPPRTGKSLMCSQLFPSWWVGKFPSDKVMQVAYEHEMAVNWGRQIRNMIRDPDFQEVFPGVDLAADSKAAGRWGVLDRTADDKVQQGEYISAGIRGGIAGKGWNLGIIDDPLSEQDAMSETAKQFVWEWYGPGFYTRRQPDRNAVVLIMTRWAKDDLAGKLLELQEQNRDDPYADKWEVLNVPAILDNDEVVEKLNAKSREAYEINRGIERALARKQGREPQKVPQYRFKQDVSFAPRRWPIGELLRTKANMRPKWWRALYMGQPAEEEGHILKRQWWKPWPQPTPPACEMIVAFYDTAMEEGETDDFSARTTWGVFASPTTGRYSVVLLERMNKRLAFPDLVDAATAHYRQYEPDLILVEKRASGHSLIQTLKRKGLPVKKWLPPGGTHSKGKLPRAHGASDILEEGLVYYMQRDWAEEVIEQCLPAGTPIICADAVRPIEDVHPGDMVLTHRGRWRPVTSTMSREADRLQRLSGKTLDAVSMTPEHPVYAHGSKDGAPEWKPAGDLTPRTYYYAQRGDKRVPEPTQAEHDRMTLPRIAPENEITEIDLRNWLSLPAGKRMSVAEDGSGFTTTHWKTGSVQWQQALDEEFGWLLGLYLAEGSASRYAVVFSLGAHETDVIEKCQRVCRRFGVRTHTETRRSVTKVMVSLPMLEQFWDEFGHIAHDKKVPGWMWDAPDEFVSGLIDGWFTGDGSYNGSVRRVTTTSHTLAWHMRLLLLRLGVHASIHERKPYEAVIEGRTHQTRCSYSVNWRPDAAYSVARIANSFASYSLDSAEQQGGPVTVYNLSVAGDESYATTGGLVHNCADFPYGEFDDLVDTVTMCLLWLRKSFLEFADEADEEDDTPEPGSAVAGGGRRLYG